MRKKTSSELLLPPYPNICLAIASRCRPLLELPDLELITTAIRLASMKIEGPVMLGAGDG